jgi:chromosome segregation ATPase
METNPEHSEIVVQLNHFIAENESLRAQLEEYVYIIDTRDKEKENLLRKMSGATELISNSDNQLLELQLLQENVRQLQKRTEIAFGQEMQAGNSVSTEQQLDNIKEEYAYLKTQLEDVQEQLQQLNNRNLMLQQKNNQVAELESLLEDAERERDELKRQLALKEEN